MIKWKDFLEQEHFDIHDMISWAETQAIRCERQDYKLIYQKFSRLLARLKEDRRRIFDERFMEPKEELEMEISKPPRLQVFLNKIKEFIGIDKYKEFLGQQK